MKWFFGFLVLVVSVFLGMIFFFMKAPSKVPPATFSEQEIAKLQASDIPKELQTEANLAMGKVYFLTHCEYCHGLQGQGSRTGPDLTDKIWLHGDGSFSNIVETVIHGVTSTTMIPWDNRLQESDIKIIAAYVRAMRHD